MKRTPHILYLLPFILLAVVVIVIAIATVLESHYGSSYAQTNVYGAWWFTTLWALTTLAGCWLLLRKKMWRQLPVMLLHVSFIVILTGALTTRITSHSGMTHLREGEVTRTFWQKDEQGDYTQAGLLPFYLALHDFVVTYDADNVTPADYVSQVIIATTDGEEPLTISMNNIGRACGYRIYQTSFDDDQQGSTFTISYDPWGTAITYSGYILLAVSMIWISVTKKRKGSTLHSTFGSIMLAVCGTAMASYMVIAICMRPLVPILRSPFLFVHVGTIMLSYILLVVSVIRRVLLRPAVFLLATGIFLGAVWANVSWGTYWSWDPKESWALITLIIYALPLHQQTIPWFRSDRHYRLYSLIALASLLMTYFGVNYLLGGMHSYA